MPPAGAGAPNVTARATDWPNCSDVFAGRLIEPMPVTVTLRVPGLIVGMLEDAVIVALPGVPPEVIVTLANVEFAGIVTVCGADAVPGALELRFRVSAVGVGEDKVTKTLFVEN